MKNLKNERGAITLVVLVTMLFLVAFLMSAFVMVSNRAQKEKEISGEIQEMYSNNQDLNEIYNSYYGEDIIPIYSAEQLLAIGSNEFIEINGQYYEMAYSATYTLMNNLEFDVDIQNEGKDWLPLNNRKEFVGYFEGNGHTIKVTNSDDKLKIYSGANNYANLPSVGDIIDYIPVSNYGTLLPYVSNLEGCEGGFSINDVGIWKVLSVDEARGIIEIIPSGVSSTSLTISGANGYNNSITALNNICEALYSNKENTKYEGIARSITIEDVLKITGYIPEIGTTYPASNFKDFPIEYLKEHGITNVTEDTEGSGFVNSSKILNISNLIVKNTYYYASVQDKIGINLNQNYWLASHSVNVASSTEANFGIRIIDSNGNIDSRWVFNSEGNEINSDNNYQVRPVVTLSLKQPLKLQNPEEENGEWGFD